MKGVVILAIVLAFLGAGVWWVVMRESMSDQGVWIVLAMGDPGKETIDLVVSVEMGLTMREPPKLNERLDPLWDEWIAQHYELRDASGKVMPFTRIAHSMLVEEEQAKNVPEFYVKYVLQQGRDYTLDFIPRVAKKGRYRHTFTAPTEPQGVQRIQFQAVTGPPRA